MVLAYHVIFCAYGFWLPNDPRGSWSDFVGAWQLLRFGRATKTDERRSLVHLTIGLVDELQRIRLNSRPYH